MGEPVQRMQFLVWCPSPSVVGSSSTSTSFVQSEAQAIAPGHPSSAIHIPDWHPPLDIAKHSWSPPKHPKRRPYPTPSSERHYDPTNNYQATFSKERTVSTGFFNSQSSSTRAWMFRAVVGAFFAEGMRKLSIAASDRNGQRALSSPSFCHSSRRAKAKHGGVHAQLHAETTPHIQEISFRACLA